MVNNILFESHWLNMLVDSSENKGYVNFTLCSPCIVTLIFSFSTSVVNKNYENK
jgi:hypothetical protein